MRWNPWLAAVSAVAIVLTGCRSEPTPSPTPTPEAAAAWPTLDVVSPVVEYRMTESDPLEPVEPGVADLDVAAGGNVVVGRDGRAMMLWSEFLSADMLRETDVLLGLSLPAQREVVIDQATGTARYALQGPGEPANVQVKAAWATVAVDAGAADWIVSLVPGIEPVAWVVVLDGRAEVSAGAPGGATVEVGAGQAAAFVEDGPQPVPVEIDRAAVLAWYEDFADGATDEGIASVAFRCVVTGTDVDLLGVPSVDEGEPTGDPLGPGTVVIIDGRDDAGIWLYARTLTSRQEGWLQARDVACVGPVSQVAPMVEEEEEEATTPTPTPTRRVIMVSATPSPLVTGTPTSTPTPSGEFKIRFWADDESITHPECTVLRWETENIREVFYQGRGVVGNGSSEECPAKDTTYELKVILRDGSTQIRTVKVTVKQAKPTTAPPTQAPPTQEPPTQEPPTQEPPTQAPPTQVPPTPDPATEAAPQPTSPRPQPWGTG